ncbi:MAG: hydantoinase/oxoprolinase family protein [Deltaproteobacteria bacterium]|nr:hydantoinase/oxoprolinase family protein [Deltaproteobacteria bacterium]
MRIAVDIGGTFTDLVALDDQGNLHRSKSLTTPEELARGIQDCFAKANIQLSTAEFFIHGSTIAINAVLERKGVATGLITTRGFRDVYEIGRGNRPEGYNLFFKRPVPLVPRDLRLEVDERLLASGEILEPLEEQSARAAIAELKSQKVESVAVCLLHSYANTAHEERLGELLRQEFPAAYVALSHEILRECREYERISTTVLNGYVGPIVTRYIISLERLFKASGFHGTFLIMQSNGGAMSVETAKKVPVTMMESGPVAGVIGAAALGEAVDCRRMISFDMGGTTAKASLIKDFHPELTSSYYIGGYVSGQPMMLPVVDIVEVGAGGGSIAWIDEAGGLKVGPRSAGAAPGPACYGRGGKDPTVTDANLVLRRIDPEYFLGGGIRLVKDGAVQAVRERIGNPLGLGLEEAALGILTIANYNMSLAVRAVSVEKGYDPRCRSPCVPSPWKRGMIRAIVFWSPAAVAVRCTPARSPGSSRSRAWLFRRCRPISPPGGCCWRISNTTTFKPACASCRKHQGENWQGGLLPWRSRPWKHCFPKGPKRRTLSCADFWICATGDRNTRSRSRSLKICADSASWHPSVLASTPSTRNTTAIPRPKSRS